LAAARVDAGVTRSVPGVDDRRADLGRAGIIAVLLQTTADEVLPRVTQLSGPLGRDRGGIDRDPRATGH
jgi:hypothetical protein